MTFRFLSLCFISLLAFGCNTGKKTVSTDIPEVTLVEERQLDTMVITAPKPNDLKRAEEYKLPRYSTSYPLKNDLIHTKLQLAFNWAKQEVIGQATLKLKPHFYPVSSLELDAQDFNIKNITFAGSAKTLKYDYDGKKLIIDLGRSIPKEEAYTLFIDYVARPSGNEQSGAILSDQGLFFINPDGSDPNKPMQIWTQGETEYNSRWFPTIDKPNVRCTQEMYLTVEDKYKTLSNGLLISSDKNSDGTRTDYWKMNQAHAPYLFMLAVGEFAVVKDTWKGMLLEYYVEQEYKPYAKQIFNHTPEMLDFFSKFTGVKYPWSKYSQIIVRDYVSGAMENTTGVIFGEFVQKTDRELIDDHNDGIVAHEMFHHWFGDLVTCESWPNLTMNEGFANYGEFLWFEHKYGQDFANAHRQAELNTYVATVNQGGAHPLIHFAVEDKEDMFDAHSYNKGGLVLHMLRQHLGDEAFSAGIQKYLTDNAYTAVEAHNLRLAMEAVSGEDLNWFFNQWYFAAGHPIIDINYEYDVAAKKINVTVEQTQDPDKYPAIFVLPFAIDVYIGKRMPVRHEVVMNQRTQTFSLDASEAPALVNVDADKYLLCEKSDNKSMEMFAAQYYNAKNFQDRREALLAYSESDTPEAAQLFKAALNDPFAGLREIALGQINPEKDPSLWKKIETFATSDPDSEVRATAFTLLGASGNAAYVSKAKKAIDTEKAYPVIAAALNTLIQLEPSSAVEYAAKLENEKSGAIINAVGSIYASNNNVAKKGFFEKNWTNLDGPLVMAFFNNYLSLAKMGNLAELTESANKLKGLATDMSQSPWRRFGITSGLNELREEYKASAEPDAGNAERINLLTKVIDEIKAKETNGQLKSIYGNF